MELSSTELSNHKVDKLGTELAFDRVPHLAFQALKQTMITHTIEAYSGQSQTFVKYYCIYNILY